MAAPKLPPVETRFEPGKSGNPGGRPKGWPEFQAAMRERSPKAVAKLEKALEAGERWAIELALAYAWGKPAQAVTGEGGEGPALVVQVVRLGDAAG